MRSTITAVVLTALLVGCSASPDGSGKPAPVPTPAAVSHTSVSVASAPAAETPTPKPSRATPTTPAARPRPLLGRTIVIDPGHNGVWTVALNRPVPAGNGRTKPCNTSGTAANGYAEHAFTWSLAQLLARRLTTLGARVVMTRSNDHGLGPCVNVRAAITNRARPELMISLHADGNLAAGARGYHIIVSHTMVGGTAVERQSLTIASKLRARLDATRTMPRSTYVGQGGAIHARTDIAGLNLIKVPGVMLELGNMHNRADLMLQRSAGWRTRVAGALTAGIVASLR